MPTLADVLRQTGYSQDGTLGTPTPTESPMTKALADHLASIPQKFNENQAYQMELLGKAFPGNTYESMMTQGDPKAMAELAMQVPVVGMTNLPRKTLLQKQFNEAESLKPSFLGKDLYEPGVKQVEFDDGNAYARFLQDNKGNLRLLTLETENSPNVRGRQILKWLKDTYQKPIKVNEVDTPAVGYWDKMQKEGLIDDWSHQMYQGKIVE